MISIAFFNNKGGVGKTSLVYHLSWMFSEMGVKVVAVDLDPQANLSAMFLDEDRLDKLWPDGDHPETVLGAVDPILRGKGDIKSPHVEDITDHLGLVAGDLGLSRFEAKLSEAWPKCVDEDESAFRVVSAFYRVITQAVETRNAQCALIDVGPNLGAINRSAMIAASNVLVPVAADLYSLQGLKNLGPTFREWRKQWMDRIARKPLGLDVELPVGEMRPSGYIILQHAVRLDRPVRAYERWMERIPRTYHTEVLGESATCTLDSTTDPECLALLKHYRSLMPLAQDARKPMFHLKSADGALGAHLSAVQECFRDFRLLANSIAEKCKVPLPSSTLWK
ncbi:MAG: AAA family ATPase [Phycisphaerales bacterium]|nr:AAA family ATPase [Phycisphaerales bacterium]